MPQEPQKKGYLKSDYRLFYLKSMPQAPIPYHYHDFHKLLFLLDGTIGYGVEGRLYHMLPGDLMLVPAGQIHSPVFENSQIYERLILYISPQFQAGSFLTESLADSCQSTKEAPIDLLTCFSSPLAGKTNLYRPTGPTKDRLIRLAREMAQASPDVSYPDPRSILPASPDPYAPFLARLRFLELLLVLNKAVTNEEAGFSESTPSNTALQTCLSYINSHLTDESLCVDEIADSAFLSRSYLMHLFKAQIGCSVGDYITKKRLYMACTLLRQGKSVTEACFQSGFRNYSAFYYAYKKKYHTSPASGSLTALAGKEETDPIHE